MRIISKLAPAAMGVLASLLSTSASSNQRVTGEIIDHFPYPIISLHYGAAYHAIRDATERALPSGDFSILQNAISNLSNEREKMARLYCALEGFDQVSSYKAETIQIAFPHAFMRPTPRFTDDYRRVRESFDETATESERESFLFQNPTLLRGIIFLNVYEFHGLELIHTRAHNPFSMVTPEEYFQGRENGSLVIQPIEVFTSLKCEGNRDEVLSVQTENVLAKADFTQEIDGFSAALNKALLYSTLHPETKPLDYLIGNFSTLFEGTSLDPMAGIEPAFDSICGYNNRN